jgi:LacI family transcriptional regulator
MKNHALTMQDLAARLGLSRSTVSAVLNHTDRRKGITAATVQRVRLAADSMGYVPSRQALRLKNSVRTGVGLLYCSPLFSHLIEAFNRITVLHHHQAESLEIQVISRTALVQGVRELLARGVDNLVWIHTLGSEKEFADPGILNYLDRFRKVIIYNYHFAPNDNSAELLIRGYYLIGVDRIASYKTLAGFIKQLGHQKVALPFNIIPSNIFDKACLEAFIQAGLQTIVVEKKTDTFYAPESILAGCAPELVSAVRKHGLTAACFLNDEYAAATLPGLVQNGLRIPQDLTVTGWNGLAFTKFLVPALTTMGVPVKAMVERMRSILQTKATNQYNRFHVKLLRHGSHAVLQRPGKNQSCPADQQHH